MFWIYFEKYRSKLSIEVIIQKPLCGWVFLRSKAWSSGYLVLSRSSGDFPKSPNKLFFTLDFLSLIYNFLERVVACRLSTKARFLNLSITDSLVWWFPIGAGSHPAQFGMFRSFPGLCVSGKLPCPTVVTNKVCPDIVKYPLGDIITIAENHFTNISYNLILLQ